MRWPWKTAPAASGTLAYSVDGDTLLWVRADGQPGRPGRVRDCGLAAATPEGEPGPGALRGPQAGHVLAVLPLHASQLLQVEAPAVPPEELRAAARWRIKDLVEGALDDYTIDVMPVGDGVTRGKPSIFVAAARNALVRQTTHQAQAGSLRLDAIDIAENTQRNLQSAAPGAAGQASAALVRHGKLCLLTLCVDGELFDARRLEAQLLEEAGAGAGPDAQPLLDDPAAPLPADWDYVDYSATPDPSGSRDHHERLQSELQRSFDIWERSHPQWPLATLWVAVGAETEAVCAALAPALSLHVQPLDLPALLPGLAEAAPDPALQARLLPLLGALLRSDTASA